MNMKMKVEILDMNKVDKSYHSIKTKCLKWIVKKHCQITKNEKHTIKNKTDKT